MTTNARTQVFDHEEWNAWHYGDNAHQRDPITRYVFRFSLVVCVHIYM